ncbi:hypothetical protein [Planctomycetes bacterium Poly30]|uniref:hypothetical protein n=1 Tax=Saltatorellus ferox TaxID=2528018 RepID=UPI0011AA4AFC
MPPVAGAGVSLVLWFVVLALRGERGRRGVAVVLAALVPAAAVATTHHLQGQSFVFPPREFMDAVLLAGAGAVLLGVLAGLGRGAWPLAAVLLLFGLGGAALFYLPTEPLHERYWDGKVLLYVGCLSVIAVVGFGGRLVAEAQRRTAESALAVALASVAAAPALGLSGTALSAMNAAALSSSAGLFGLMVVALLHFRAEEVSFRPVGRAAATTQSALFAGFVANGVLYAETPRTAGILLLAAPLLVLLPGRSLAGRPWLASVVRLTLVAGVVAYAAYLSKGEPDPYGY